MIEDVCHGCRWYHRLSDMNPELSHYQIDFCGFDMEAIPICIGCCRNYEETE